MMMEGDSDEEFVNLPTPPAEPNEESSPLLQIQFNDVQILREMEEKAIARQHEVSQTKSVTIVLLGKTGEGKSSTGNTLLAEKRFETGFGQNSQTQTTKCEEITLENLSPDLPPKIDLKIIDTPGLFDQPDQTEDMKSLRQQLKESNSSNSVAASLQTDSQIVEESLLEQQKQLEQKRDEFLENEIQKCIQLCGSGVDAFFLVMNSKSRFDRNCRQTLDVLTKMFGAAHLANYLFVVFTHADELEENDIKLDDFLETYLHDDVKQLLADINNRHIFVDNTVLRTALKKGGNLELLNEERKKILQAVLHNTEQRNELRYTSRHFCIPEMKLVKRSVESSFGDFQNQWNEISDAIEQTKLEYVKCGNLGSEIEGGASVASLIVGSLLQIGGILFAAPTAGLSLGLTAAGVGVSVLGGGINIGSTVVTGKNKKSLINEINEKIAGFFASSDVCLNSLVEAQRNVLKMKLEYWPAAVADKIVNDYETRDKELYAYGQLGASVPKVIWGAAQTSFMTAVKVSDDFAKVVGLGARAVPIVGLVVGALADLFGFSLAVHNRVTNKAKADALFQEMKDKCENSINHIRQRKTSLVEEIDEFCKDPNEACCCVICDELWEDPVICPQSTKHIGCRMCIQKWLNLSETCPTCRCQWPSFIPEE